MLKFRIERANSKFRIRSRKCVLVTFSKLSILNKVFLSTYALPIARKAIEEYLKLDTVEVTSGLASWDGTKVSHLEFCISILELCSKSTLLIGF